MAEFNNNPTEFVDFNYLFPVLNEKVGLTYEQWRKAIENINFVKANLGVSDVERGKVNISIVEDESLVGLDITTREGIVEKNGIQRTIIYVDFDLKVPAGQVTSVNGQTGAVEVMELHSENQGFHTIGVGSQATMFSLSEDAKYFSEVTARNGKIEIVVGEQGGSPQAYMNLENGEIALVANKLTHNGNEIGSGGIKQLVGTAEKPINLATDIEVGEICVVSGFVYRWAPNYTLNFTTPSIIFKETTTELKGFNFTLSGATYVYRSGVLCKIRIYEDGQIDITRTYISAMVSSHNGTVVFGELSFYSPTDSGSAGQILQSNGASKAPIWVDPATAGIATVADIETAIGNVSALLGDTDDLEV